MKKLAFVVISFVFFVACGPKKEITVVKPLSDAIEKSSKGIIYSLPRTILTFKVKAKETKVIPGPYYKYAKRFLGVDGVPEKYEKYWELSSVEVNTGNEMDSQHLYLIEPGNDFAIDFLSFSKEGLILPYATGGSEVVEKTIEEPVLASPYFTDLSVKRFEGAKRDTVYRRVFRDSVFVRVPVLRTQVGKRTLEEKAAEAAHFLFKLRKRRFKLLAGMYEKVASGPSLDVSVRELDKIEKEYLSLFIGKRLEREVVKEFQVIPGEQHLENPMIVFRFIPEYGILEPDDLRGRPAFLDFEQENKTIALKNYNLLPSKEKGKDLPPLVYYRVPEICGITLMYGKDMLLKQRVAVYQFGEVIHAPVPVLPEQEYLYYKKKK